VRWEGDAGVLSSGDEPSELDDQEETETERLLREVFIVIGSECFTKSVELESLLLDILYRRLIV